MILIGTRVFKRIFKRNASNETSGRTGIVLTILVFILHTMIYYTTYIIYFLKNKNICNYLKQITFRSEMYNLYNNIYIVETVGNIFLTSTKNSIQLINIKGYNSNNL